MTEKLPLSIASFRDIGPDYHDAEEVAAVVVHTPQRQRKAAPGSVRAHEFDFFECSVPRPCEQFLDRIITVWPGRDNPLQQLSDGHAPRLIGVYAKEIRSIRIEVPYPPARVHEDNQRGEVIEEGVVRARDHRAGTPGWLEPRSVLLIVAGTPQRLLGPLGTGPESLDFLRQVLMAHCLPLSTPPIVRRRLSVVRSSHTYSLACSDRRRYHEFALFKV